MLPLTLSGDTVLCAIWGRVVWWVVPQEQACCTARTTMSEAPRGSEVGITPLGEAFEQKEQATSVVDVVSDGTARGRSMLSAEILLDYKQPHTEVRMMVVCIQFCSCEF